MAYKPAYMLFLGGTVKAFVGNYDNLADVIYDHDRNYFYCWEEKHVFYIHRFSEEERREMKRAG